MIAFEHQTDVRRIVFGEFDLPTAVEILRDARREVNEASEITWDYAAEPAVITMPPW